MRLRSFRRLRKELGLFDVYVVSTGAMISSGFFMLPGIAATHSGPGVVLAYLLAGAMIVPAMLSMAELATAMPRAGGTYYFLDRTLGPLTGTIGGVGTWFTLILKSAFALIGMGAYVGLVFAVPILPTALAFTVAFAILNIVGAKESSGLLRILVVVLLTVLGFFLVHGLVDVAAEEQRARANFSPFLPFGFDGVLETVGLVFISYIGLTKVSSLAEEVKNPDRNIPLGMTLALATVTTVYVVGVFIMVALLGTAQLSGSLTPVADTAARFTAWLPPEWGRWMMIGAAIVAFAAMANAGILAASRYPLAMARDHLFPHALARTSGRGTPVAAILITCLLLAACLLVLNVNEVAELASSLQLLLFGLINIAVIVMRESRIESYDPGFRSPFYPWMQLAGVFVALVLVAEMGWLSVLFTVAVIAICFGWYTYWARPRIVRGGAIFHVFERLGRRRFAGLEQELRDLMKEKGLRAEDPFDEVVTRAVVVDHPAPADVRELVRRACEPLAPRLAWETDALERAFLDAAASGPPTVTHGAALVHTRLADYDGSELALVRCAGGVSFDSVPGALEGARQPVHALFLLASDTTHPGRHLRILAQLASHAEDQEFLERWLAARHEAGLKETLLRDDRFLTLRVQDDTPAASLAGRELRELEMPAGALVALIRRRGRQLVPRGRTRLEHGDRLTIIGDPDDIRALDERYGNGAHG